MLHMLAIVEKARARDDSCSDYLASAAEIERAAGYTPSAQQTSHRLSLLAHSRISPARSYYRETLTNLRRFRNLPGMAMCLRSLGEFTLAAGRSEDAKSLWQRSQQPLVKTRIAEAELLEAWIEAFE